MTMTINSRLLETAVTFSRPGSGYLFVNVNRSAGSLGLQICVGGKTTGETISYSGSSQTTFEKICRRWFRAYLQDTKWERDIDDRYSNKNNPRTRRVNPARRINDDMRKMRT